jgi:molybdate transport system substrate-binding protein
MTKTVRGRCAFARLGTAGILTGLLGWLLLAASPAPAGEVTLLAGAGLRQATDVLTARFEALTGHRVLTSYDGSGRLLARVRASGEGDLFMPGALFYIEHLRKEGRVRAVRPVAAHTPVVGVSRDRDSAEAVQVFEDLTRPGVRIALGDPDAMAFGRTAREILRRAGLEERVLKNVTVYGGTVKQLALYVARGDVDAAVIGRADAFQFRERIRIVPIPPAWFQSEIIAVAVLDSARRPDVAEQLSAYLASDEALEVFREFGFLPLEE